MLQKKSDANQQVDWNLEKFQGQLHNIGCYFNTEQQIIIELYPSIRTLECVQQNIDYFYKILQTCNADFIKAWGYHVVNYFKLKQRSNKFSLQCRWNDLLILITEKALKNNIQQNRQSKDIQAVFKKVYKLIDKKYIGGQICCFECGLVQNIFWRCTCSVIKCGVCWFDSIVSELEEGIFIDKIVICTICKQIINIKLLENIKFP